MRPARAKALLVGQMSTLTYEQHLMLELIADKPIAATPEFARYTAVLAAAHLIELSPDAFWRLTPLARPCWNHEAVGCISETMPRSPAPELAQRKTLRTPIRRALELVTRRGVRGKAGHQALGSL